HEYFKNRPDVILTQSSLYDNAKRLLDSLVQKAEADSASQLNFRSHPFIDKSDFVNSIKSAIDIVQKSLDEKRKSYPDSVIDDEIQKSLNTLFDGRVGDPFSEADLKKIFEEGKVRYDKDIPPGYEDSRGPNKKQGEDVYGDV